MVIKPKGIKETLKQPGARGKGKGESPQPLSVLREWEPWGWGQRQALHIEIIQKNVTTRSKIY